MKILKEIFHKKFDQKKIPQNNWSTRNFPQSMKFPQKNWSKTFFHSQGNFPKKGSLKAEILGLFNTKSHPMQKYF